MASDRARAWPAKTMRLPPGPSQSLQSLPLLAYWVTTVSVNEKNDRKTERERGKEKEKETKSWERAEMCKQEPVRNMLTAHLGSINFPDTTNRPMRFQGRLWLEKQSHLMFANTTPGLSERQNGSKEAHTAKPSITRAGLVSFNYFQALSLGRVGLVLSVRLEEKYDNAQDHPPPTHSAILQNRPE